MHNKMTRSRWWSFTKPLIASVGTLVAAETPAANFEGSLVPIRVRTAMCDSNPRILVEFADTSKNVWYPANLGDSSKYFLATALAAKVSGQELYFLGVDDTATFYCVGAGRQVQVFGVSG